MIYLRPTQCLELTSPPSSPALSPLTHTTVSHGRETRGPRFQSARAVFLNYVSYIWEFLGNVCWCSWEFPSRKLPRSREVFHLWKSQANCVSFSSLEPAKGCSAADKAFPSALCENRILWEYTLLIVFACFITVI